MSACPQRRALPADKLNVRYVLKADIRKYSMNSAAGWKVRRRTVIAAAVEGSIGSAPINVTLR
jgi:hypothetical protein